MEIIDVIDTAVKIGLGATITGIATYIITNINHKNELEKQHTNENKELLKEISRKIESSEANLNRTTLSYIQNKEQTFESQHILTSISEAYEARALSNLIGETELSEKIGTMTHLLENTCERLLMPNQLKSAAIEINKIETCKKSMYPLISKAYENYKA